MGRPDRAAEALFPCFTSGDAWGSLSFEGGAVPGSLSPTRFVGRLARLWPASLRETPPRSLARSARRLLSRRDCCPFVSGPSRALAGPSSPERARHSVPSCSPCRVPLVLRRCVRTSREDVNAQPEPAAVLGGCPWLTAVGAGDASRAPRSFLASSCSQRREPGGALSPQVPGRRSRWSPKPAPLPLGDWGLLAAVLPPDSFTFSSQFFFFCLVNTFLGFGLSKGHPLKIFLG